MSPSLRSSDPKPTEPQTHILNFFYDDDNGCALTARINDVRFHILVNPKPPGSNSSELNDIHAEYLRKIAALRWRDGNHKSDRSRSSTSEETDLDGHSLGESTDAKDSAIDLTADVEKDSKQHKSSNDKDHIKEEDLNVETDLQNWILQCFAEEVAQHAPASKQPSESCTLERWYNTPIHYYKVRIQDTGFVPTKIDETDTLRKHIDDLQPSVPLPKSLRTSTVPWTSPSSITVLSTATDPSPIHPTLVSVHDSSTNSPTTQFFKPVDPTQPQPTKREIKILLDLEKKNLHNSINVPHLLGLVSSGTSKTHCMGLLLTPIPDAIPLTKLMDSEVDASKREKWAKEAKRIVKVLHDNGVVWGDAKGDNFLVDQDDKLWIIDFGGSYTEGWVDEEIMETELGDDMGLEKVQNGLRDPDGFTFDPEEEVVVEEQEVGDEAEKGKGKRGREESEEAEEREEETPRKRKR